MSLSQFSAAASYKLFKIASFIFLVGIIFGFDQGSKQWVADFFQYTSQPYKVNDFLNIIMTYNTGISFGMLKNLAYGHIIISGFALLMIALFSAWLWANPYWDNILAIGLVVGGAVGNVWDRLNHPGVVDFIDLHYMGYHYPAFNIADSAIVIGVIILLFKTFLTSSN